MTIPLCKKVFNASKMISKYFFVTKTFIKCTVQVNNDTVSSDRLSTDKYDRLSTDKYVRLSTDKYDRLSTDKYDLLSTDKYDRLRRNCVIIYLNCTFNERFCNKEVLGNHLTCIEYFLTQWYSHFLEVIDQVYH
jgi:hypothetical protein